MLHSGVVHASPSLFLRPTTQIISGYFSTHQAGKIDLVLTINLPILFSYLATKWPVKKQVAIAKRHEILLAPWLKMIIFKKISKFMKKSIKVLAAHFYPPAPFIYKISNIDLLEVICSNIDFNKLCDCLFKYLYVHVNT